MCDDVPKKKEYLRDSREKLNKAIKVNADAVTPDGERTIFQLVNAFCEEPFRPKIRPKGAEQSESLTLLLHAQRESERKIAESERVIFIYIYTYICVYIYIQICIYVYINII